MSSFASFCVPEVEGCDVLQSWSEVDKSSVTFEQVGLADFSRITCEQVPCLQRVATNCDSSIICSTDATGSLRFLETHQFRCTLTNPRAHAAPVTDCSFAHNDRNVLITASQDGSVKIWDLRLLGSSTDPVATLQLGPLGFNEADLWAIAFREDDRIFATAYKNTTKLFDLRVIGDGIGCGSGRSRKSAKQSRRPVSELLVHGDTVTSLCFHPIHTRFLISGGEDSLVCISDTYTAPAEGSNGYTGYDVDGAASLAACFSHERAVKNVSCLGPQSSCVCICSAMEDAGLWQVSGFDSWRGPENRALLSVQRQAEWLSVRSHPELKEGDSCGYIVSAFYDEDSGRLFFLTGRFLTGKT